MTIRISRGADNAATLTTQRFLVQHGFLSTEAANSNPGYYGENTQAALARFIQTASRHLRMPAMDAEERSGRVISDETVSLMRGWENNYQNFYRRNPSEFGAAGTTYQMDPTSETLRTARGRIPIEDFDPRRVTFVIDPGHGVIKRAGHDMGAGNGLEARITRGTALDVARALNARGFDVIVTRDDDNSSSPDGFRFRHHAARAGTAGFVSLHADMAANSGVQGTRLIVDDRASSTSRSQDLRQHVADRDRGDMIVDPIHRERSLAMLSPRSIGAMTPAMLVEMGFLSNPRDRANLTSQTWRTRFANELADDLVEFSSMRDDLTELANGRISGARSQTRAPQSAPSTGRSQPRETESEAPRTAPTDRRSGPRIYRYEIDPGDNLTRIAQRYNLSVADIRTVNDLRSTVLRPGQELILPGVREVDVQRGETLTQIAGRIAAADGASGVSTGQAMQLIRALNPDIGRNGHVQAGADLLVPRDTRSAADMLARRSGPTVNA